MRSACRCRALRVRRVPPRGLPSTSPSLPYQLASLTRRQLRPRSVLEGVTGGHHRGVDIVRPGLGNLRDLLAVGGVEHCEASCPTGHRSTSPPISSLWRRAMKSRPLLLNRACDDVPFIGRLPQSRLLTASTAGPGPVERQRAMRQRAGARPLRPPGRSSCGTTSSGAVHGHAARNDAPAPPRRAGRR